MLESMHIFLSSNEKHLSQGARHAVRYNLAMFAVLLHDYFKKICRNVCKFKKNSLSLQQNIPLR